MKILKDLKIIKNFWDLEEPAKEFCGPNYITADRFFLVAMPLSFLVFNIIYWLSYGSQFIWTLKDSVEVWETLGVWTEYVG